MAIAIDCSEGEVALAELGSSVDQVTFQRSEEIAEGLGGANELPVRSLQPGCLF